MSKQIEEILSKLSLVELIKESVILKKHGKEYLGLCPFHAEKTPSFSVSDIKGQYYCFGCQSAGNAITYCTTFYNMNFKEALEHLANKTGVSLQDTLLYKKNL